MRILFVMRHSGYVRNFESTLRLLASRGHAVHLAFQNPVAHPLLDATDVAGQLEAEYPSFSRGAIPVRDDAWGHAARDLRVSLDYLRYLEPTYADAPKLTARAAKEASKDFVKEADAATPDGRARLARRLRADHAAIPTDARIDAFLEAHRPDVLVLTPLIEPGSPQAEYVRSARALGIRTALLVASWDNLTNKGLIHGDVDRVMVWNEAMRAEAVRLQGVPAERVVVTGAQPFDHWFTWQPSTSRAEFCAQAGLPPDRPYLLYLCSSRFIAPQEVPFVQRWIAALRESASPRLREAGILVRPHPQNADQWKSAPLSGLDAVTVWPPHGRAPSDTAGRNDYFDSIFHSAAVVGINTTAEIESAIVGRPVYTVTDPEFRDTQGGTLHFEHLRSANGGLVHVAEDLTAHAAQVDAALAHPGDDGGRGRRFVEAFVRPHGLDQPATPRVADALEALAAQPAPAPARPSRVTVLLRGALEQRGRALQRAAVLAAEERAARTLAKKRAKAPASPVASAPPVAPAAVDEAAEPPVRTGKAIRNWKDLARAYLQLDYRQRVYFGRATLDETPGELLHSVFEHAKPERLDFPDADIFLRVTSKAERMRLRACAKEPFTVQWLREHVGAGEVLYDIGSNIGVYSLVAAKKPEGGARVFAFDPSYANIASLGSSTVLNGVEDAITPLPVALSDRTGLAVFNLRSMEPGSARHALDGVVAGEEPTLYRQPVMTFRLDDLVTAVGLPLPAHIKLDVDGGELAVLDGAARTLASPGLKTVLIEVSTELSDAIAQVLAGHGLRLHAKVDVQNRAGEYLVWYGLFTRDASVPAKPVETVAR